MDNSTKHNHRTTLLNACARIKDEDSEILSNDLIRNYLIRALPQLDMEIRAEQQLVERALQMLRRSPDGENEPSTGS